MILCRSGLCCRNHPVKHQIEQEQNGLYTYDRQKKFSDEIYELIRASNAAKAAIEDE